MRIGTGNCVYAATATKQALRLALVAVAFVFLTLITTQVA